MNGQNIAYIRVSTQQQNIDRQIESLKNYNIDKWFIEKKSAKNRDRPELKNLLDYVREGDTVYIVDFSRIARNTKDLLDIVEELTERKINIISLKENFDTNNPVGKLMLTLLAAIYQFEREIKLEMQLEGIAIAKDQGKYKGRKKIQVDDNEFKRLYDRYLKNEITKKEMAILLKVSRPTLNKIIKEKTKIK